MEKKAELLQEIYAGAPKLTDAELQMTGADCRHRDSADLQRLIVEKQHRGRLSHSVAETEIVLKKVRTMLGQS